MLARCVPLPKAPVVGQSVCRRHVMKCRIWKTGKWFGTGGQKLSWQGWKGSPGWWLVGGDQLVCTGQVLHPHPWHSYTCLVHIKHATTFLQIHFRVIALWNCFFQQSRGLVLYFCKQHVPYLVTKLLTERWQNYTSLLCCIFNMSPPLLPTLLLNKFTF